MTDSVIARLPGSTELDSEKVDLDAPDATPGKLMAAIYFYETPLGAMAIEPCHVGEFNPNIQQHRVLELICQLLPQIVQPVDMATFESAAQTHEAPEAQQ